MSVETDIAAIRKELNSIRTALLNVDAWATKHVLISIGISLVVGALFGRFVL